MLENEMTILVASCDQYADIWDDFFACKEQNWPDCPFKTVLVTNHKIAENGDCETITCGDTNWSTRIRLALEAINTKYVCFLMEDFLISEPVDTNEINNLVKMMDCDGLKYCKLCNGSPIKTAYYKEYRYVRVIPANYRYGISLMAAIWDRQFFIECLGTEDYSPWKFEFDRNQEAAVATDELAGVYDERNILHICQLVVQGKIMPAAVREMKRKNYRIRCQGRPILSFRETFLFWLKNNMSELSKSVPMIKRIAVKLGYREIGAD